MNRFLTLPADERRRLCEEAENRLGLEASSIEKDFWVCWTLRELFALPEIGEHLTFKGGTSLSKGWRLIERFSEDIDVVVERDYLGFGGERAPEQAGSNRERERRLDAVLQACAALVGGALRQALEERCRLALAALPGWDLVEDPEDEDRQTLLFSYPSVLPAHAYLRPVVRIELGARSDTEPSLNPTLRPYLAEAFPDELTDSVFSLRAVAPERTFWEKAMLLHEETYRAGDGPKARLARHYYDLWCLIRAGVAQRALEDAELFARVATHRSVFFRRSREAQKSLRPGSLRLLPAADRRTAWAEDYEAMRESMFFGEAPGFNEVLLVVGDFELRFNEGK